jgi:catechol-2,3-dioxygenase
MADSKTYRLTHFAIAVNDVERTGKFYKQVLDMQSMYQQNGFIQPPTPGCNDILVFEEKKDKSIGETGGIAHVVFGLKTPAVLMKMANRNIAAGGH